MANHTSEKWRKSILLFPSDTCEQLEGNLLSNWAKANYVDCAKDGLPPPSREPFSLWKKTSGAFCVYTQFKQEGNMPQKSSEPLPLPKVTAGPSLLLLFNRITLFVLVSAFSIQVRGGGDFMGKKTWQVPVQCPTNRCTRQSKSMSKAAPSL